MHLEKKLKKYIPFIVLAVFIFLAIFIYNLSLNESGDFISKILNSDKITAVEIKKTDTRTDDIKEQKRLDNNEIEEPADYFENKNFKKINSDTIKYDSKEGYLLEAIDRDEKSFLL